MRGLEHGRVVPDAVREGIRSYDGAGLLQVRRAEEKVRRNGPRQLPEPDFLGLGEGGEEG